MMVLCLKELFVFVYSLYAQLFRFWSFMSQLLLPSFIKRQILEASGQRLL